MCSRCSRTTKERCGPEFLQFRRDSSAQFGVETSSASEMTAVSANGSRRCLRISMATSGPVPKQDYGFGGVGLKRYEMPHPIETSQAIAQGTEGAGFAFARSWLTERGIAEKR